MSRPFSEPISRLLREGNDGTSARRSTAAVAIALAAANARWTLDQLPTALLPLNQQCGDWLRVWQRSRTGGTRTERRHDADRDPVFARLPRALAAAQQHAARQGMSVNDLVGLLLSREVSVPYSSQEALPLA